VIKRAGESGSGERMPGPAEKPFFILRSVVVFLVFAIGSTTAARPLRRTGTVADKELT
jgi:hypothetical protein